MSRISDMDFTTKIILIILVVVISYLALLLVLSELFVQNSTSWTGMMDHMTDNATSSVVVNLVSLTIALVVGVLFALLWLKPQKTEPTPAQTDELEIIKRALSDDEKAVIDEIKKAGEITQDSLRFRLDWSKAKLSRILTNLDKMNVIQRERVGKIYKVFISKKK